MPHARMSQTPRPVVPAVTIAVLFGSILTQSGLFISIFGLGFLLVFVPMTDLSSVVHFQGPLPKVQGQVIGVEETNSEENERDIYAIEYQYQLRGKTYEGVSFTSAMNYAPGMPVSIEYLTRQPERSRIQGLRTAPFEAWVLLFLLLFPALGLLLASFPFFQGLKALPLLKDGLLTTAQLRGEQRTSMRINERPVYLMNFAFQARHDGRIYEVGVRTHEPEKLRDQADEPLLYNPKNPNHAILLNSLPQGIQIGAKGFPEPRSYPQAMLSLLLPLSALGMIFWVLRQIGTQL
jgi:hypothetical protein